ncbi:dipeptidase [Prauserella endophytica]|uniref:Thermostable dipeptidase n=1 Tax=Prauserella endophytica TaxID=1592324 RepID=A0ABY2RV29_9PSEU|nr:membrane dipeptidase [Prauserella endophytica]TKG60801.1 thermostable dipeptidase [Prauserella endophytica]
MIPMADCHDDLLMAVRHLRERGHRDPFGDFWLPQLREGGVVLQVLPVYTEEQFVGEGALRRALLLLEEARQLAEVHSAEVSIVETSEELSRTLEQGRIALLLAIEGAEPVGNDLAMLDVFWRAGVRMASLTWNRRTMLADGVGEQDTGGRLTALGVDAVAEMERLGVVLDVSHLSMAGFWHVAEVARRPFVASHSSCRALQAHPRNLTDDQIRAIAASGGFVGINAFGPFLYDQPELRHYVDHAAHAVELVGAGHVALGPDFMDDVARTVDPILQGALVDVAALPVVKDLRRPADLAKLGPLLMDRLGKRDALAVAAGTLIDFLGRALPR